MEEDLSTFCSNSSSASAKASALKKIVHNASSTGLDVNLLFQQFSKVCSTLFGTEKDQKPLLTDDSIKKDLISMLKMDPSTANLPFLFQSSLRSSGTLLETSSPYFILPSSYLPNHIKKCLNNGQIELLPLFFQKHSECINEKKDNQLFTQDMRTSQEYELRLNVLEYYLFWFIQFPIIHTSLTNTISKSEPKKTKSDHNWLKDTFSNLSPHKKTSKKEKGDKKEDISIKNKHIYIILLENYLKHFCPYDTRKTIASYQSSNALIELIIQFWLDYGPIDKNVEVKLPSSACFEGIEAVVSYFVSDNMLTKSDASNTWWNDYALDFQKPFYDFLNTSFDIWSELDSIDVGKKIVDVWTVYILPWRKHETPKLSLEDCWVSFIQHNILFYLVITEKFLKYVKRIVNTATREQDLKLVEDFVSTMKESNLYKYITETVSIITEIQSNQDLYLYPNQSPEYNIIAGHFAKMEMNINHFKPLFSPVNQSLPKSILDNMSQDIVYCFKYHPDNSPVKRIEKVADDFASIFNLQRYWYSIKPNPKQIAKDQDKDKGKANKKMKDLAEKIEYTGNYWNAPLMSYENGFIAEKAYHLAMYIQNRYHLPEPPHIRWIASYQVWIFACIVVLSMLGLWSIAVFLARLIIG